MLKLVDVSLGEEIRLFSNIAVEISSQCNRSCKFCPNSIFERPDEYMPMEMIERIVAELKSLKYNGRYEHYIYNEPTRDARLLEVITYVKKELPRATQMINTNGDYFKSADDIWALFEAGINQMQINIYSSGDGSPSEKIFNNGVRLAQKREAKMQNWVDSLTEKYGLSQELSLYQNIGPSKKVCKVVNKYGVLNTFTDKDAEGPNVWTNRSGLVPQFKEGLQEPISKHCTKPFRFLNINWRGEAFLCCNDFNAETSVGNVNEKTLVELWNSFELNVYRLKLQNKKRDCFLCNKCDFNGGYYPHMIDNVTFGEENDKMILNSDFSDRSSIFKFPPALIPIPKEQ